MVTCHHYGGGVKVPSSRKLIRRIPDTYPLPFLSFPLGES